ncbi:amidohydrolase family protein [Streptomyces turgidiscabies]|uniref:Cytosine/adenosine deaminase-related metal-dependent hydrolase n=1 Tax=Streptomyces turgidiscabies TaxID=85558 RepID=A0ABU0RTZ0_9ACTN|nr:amidohydrolase family protein [Streptomyces turgidiscabies]MDQ0935468.1 cytosine/adenosine deaminase-related metal-dependent hydrolase [Streptomyces turgidiscabies]
MAVDGGRVTAVRAAGTEPEARTTLTAAGWLVTPGLINTHHPIYQNLTRSYAPAVNGTLVDRLTTLYPLWATLDEEAAYVSTDHASLRMETRGAMLLGRYRGGPGAMTARDALDIATRGSARCLGRADEIGHLRPGACADLVVRDPREVVLAGALSDPVEAWLRCGPARA